MKQKKGMIIAIIILAVLIVLYFAVDMWNKKAAEEEEEKEAAETIHLVDENNLTQLRYTDGESSMGFVKEGDTWYYESDGDISISQDVVGTIVSQITGLTAVRELENPDDIGDYGLDKPAYTVTFTGENKSSAVYIGDVAGENYYAMVEDDDKVYTISGELTGYLYFDLADLVQYDTVPSIESGNLKKVEVTETGVTNVYEEDEELAELAGGFGTLTLTDCVNYNASESDIASCGLDEAHRVKATAIYDDSTSGNEEAFTVYAGNLTEDGAYRYVTVEGSHMIYQVNKDIVANMLSTE